MNMTAGSIALGQYGSYCLVPVEMQADLALKPCPHAYALVRNRKRQHGHWPMHIVLEQTKTETGTETETLVKHIRLYPACLSG